MEVLGIHLLLLRATAVHGAPTFSLPLKSHGLHLHRQLHWRVRQRRFGQPFLAHRLRNVDPPSASVQFSADALLRLRGGEISAADKDSAKPAKINRFRIASSAAIITVATMLLLLNMTTLKSFFDRESIIQRLNYLKAKKNGLLLYSCGFIFWEVVGLPTAVVETAAGAVFGFRDGLTGSFFGKTCGSIVAFTLGRTLLSNRARQSLVKNDSYELIQQGFSTNPMLSAFIVRYSPFPQLIKNYAVSMTELSYPMFVLVAIVHGLPFSILWAAAGNDASLRLRTLEAGETMAANAVINWSIVFVAIFGFFISPAFTGLWLADLRKARLAE